MSQRAGDLAKLFSRLGLLCVMTLVPPLVAGCTAVKDKRAGLVEASSASGGSGWRPEGGAGGVQASKPPAAGSGGTNHAGSRAFAGDAAGSGRGGQGAAGSAANSGSSAAAGAGWFCMNVAESCACVEAAGVTGKCTVTPPCCFALTMVGLNTCQCWPENSEPCRDLRAGATDKKAIPSCPP